MLVHLRVQNIALIDEVAIDLGEGLNVLSGETGAGKSILLGAINLALGARGSKSLLRDAARPAAVELLFVDEKPAVQEMLAEWGIEAAGGEIIIARRFTPSGRSICQINQQLVTTAQVKKLAAQLIDIHGQHEHQSLLDSSRHIDLLDRFIPEVDPLAKRLTHAWEEHRKLQDEWERYEQNGRDRERLLSLMQYELTEIEEAAWQEGEEEALQEERKKLLYSEKLSESCLGAYTDLHGQQLRERSVIDSLEDALQKIQDAARYDDAFFFAVCEYFAGASRGIARCCRQSARLCRGAGGRSGTPYGGAGTAGCDCSFEKQVWADMAAGENLLRKNQSRAR